MTQEQALSILKTGANVFLTGEPGSGKTHTVNEYIKYLREHKIEPSITASTGIAATHIGGMTIHSWSGIGIKKNLDQYALDKITTTEYLSKRLRSAKVLIIDEISMLSPKTLDMVDMVLRSVRENTYPFGGLQVVFVGDFFQLPAIITKDEKEDSLFGGNTSRFAFSASSWERAKVIVCHLSDQYRQDDTEFLSVLSSIRQNIFDQEHFEVIKRRQCKIDNIPSGTPKLFAHNFDVDTLNQKTLSSIEGDTKTFEASSTGTSSLIETLKRGCLSPEKLFLKKGATVMFTKNNPKLGFVNGTIGEVVGFDSFSSLPTVKTKDDRLIQVDKMEWSIEDNGKIKARLSQIPLRLAWAITIHKSQGMSLDSAVMDLSGVFEYGQGYVALSRVRRLSGLYILGFNPKAFQVHPEVLEKDKELRESSSEADDYFSVMSKNKVEEMHKNFILACGGVLEKKKKVIKKESGGSRLEEIRKKFPNAYRPWEEADDIRLRKMFEENFNFETLAKEFGRGVGAIKARLVLLGLIEEE